MSPRLGAAVYANERLYTPAFVVMTSKGKNLSFASGVTSTVRTRMGRYVHEDKYILSQS